MTVETKELAELAVSLKQAADETKRVAEQSQNEIKSLGKTSQETAEKADAALVRLNETQARIDSLEQKMARRGADEAPVRRKSMGELVTDDEGVQSFLKAKSRGRVKVDVKAITSSSADAMGSAGALVLPDTRTGIIAPPQQRLTVRDLLAPGTTESNSLQVMRESGFVNAAASVPELGLKPESDLQFEMVTTPVATIAHFVRASRQILDDAAQLRSYINQRLMYGLALEEERQLLGGSGTGGDLQGILTVAQAYSAPIAITGATHIDTLRLAMLQAVLAEYPASGIVMSPQAWAGIELQKDANGQYLWSSPTAGNARTLWGLPVVETPAMAANAFVIGGFRMAAQIYDRMDATIEISTEDVDNFRRNAVTILCEERLALGIFRPEAMVRGTFA